VRNKKIYLIIMAVSLLGTVPGPGNAYEMIPRESGHQSAVTSSLNPDTSYKTPTNFRKYDLDAGVLQIQKNAENGVILDQYLVGIMYFEGYGLNRDIDKSLYWLRKAADGGFPKAQNDLGLIYCGSHIRGVVPQDLPQGLMWLRKAAEAGLADAQYNLAGYYKVGYGVQQDYKEAFKWFKKAADQGFYGAQYELGVLYGSGAGIGRDLKLAEYWTTKAAGQGFKQAQDLLEELRTERAKALKNAGITPD
jgi:TPR repeat protein